MIQGPFTLSDSDSENRHFLLCFAAYTLIFSDGFLIFFAFAITQCKWTLKARSHSAFFSDCDCDSSYRNKYVAQDSMEVFTLCDCNNITNSYVTHCKQKTSQSQSEKIALCEQALRTDCNHLCDKGSKKIFAQYGSLVTEKRSLASSHAGGNPCEKGRILYGSAT